MFPLRDDQPTYTPPIVTTLIIVACALVFLYEISLDEYSRDYLINRYGLVPTHFRPSALVTSMFLHGGWMHIIGNMIYLWAFGREIEDAMGSFRFLVFYLAGGLIAMMAQVMADPSSSIPVLGASGAIAAVMGAFIVTFPRDRIRTVLFFLIFFRVTHIPAVLVIGFWFLMQVLNFGSVAEVRTGGVAYLAHIAGFLFGVVFARLLVDRQRVAGRTLTYY